MPSRRRAVPDRLGDPVLRFMRLIWAIDHELQSVSKRMEALLGLTVPQRMTLLLIGRHPGILSGELASLLHLHPGTISGIVGRLEASSLITRSADTVDARRVRLTVTPAGQAVNRRRTGTFESAVRNLLAASSRPDLEAAERVLTQLAARLKVTAEKQAAMTLRKRSS